MRLGYLDAMKAFHFFDGEKFSFAKGAFTRHQLTGAEACAEIFKLDPGILYTKETCMSIWQKRFPGQPCRRSTISIPRKTLCAS